jgi:ornithine carbamoyltransferase
MKWRGWRGWFVALLMVCAPVPLAIAQSNLDAATTNEQYVPRLGDIMNAIQTRDMKLWFAGKALNWELAAYELRQLKAGLLEAAVLYEGIPVTNVTTMTAPVQSIADAIGAKDSRRFARATSELTAGCNACHRSMARGFIVMQTPTLSPFSDQSFAPQRKQ